MEPQDISADFNFEMHHVDVLDSPMAYIDTRAHQPGPVCLFLHGNPTSSYIWRNVIPHISPKARCIAPDLIGMGRSGKPAGIEYRFSDHQRYLEAFLDTVLPHEQIVLVLHDWGSMLGLAWARRNESRVLGIALMEFISAIPSWQAFPDAARSAFQGFRNPEVGRKLLIEENAFVEQLLPSSVVRKLTEAEVEHYREPYKLPASREPLWCWPNELPIGGSPADMLDIVAAAHSWLNHTELPKVLFWSTPGGLVSMEQAEQYAQTWKNTRSVGIGPGVHYLQEDNPYLIGEEIEDWLQNTVQSSAKSWLWVQKIYRSIIKWWTRKLSGILSCN